MKKLLSLLILSSLVALGAPVATKTVLVKQEEGVAESGIQKRSSDPGAPVTNQLWLNTSEGKVKYYDGSSNRTISGTGGGGGILLNENADFESGTTGWTASGGTFAINSTAANVGFGSKSGSWDASASGQYLSYAAIAVPAGLYGKVCTLSWYYKGGDANLKMEVTDGTDIIAESSAFTAQADFSAKQVMYFTCPASGNIVARVASTADAALVYLDDVKLGQELLLNSGSSYLYGSWSMSGAPSCSWSSSLSSYTSFTANANCNDPVVTGGVTSAGKSPSFTLNNLPKGSYIVFAQGQFANAGTGVAAEYRLYDGTTASGYSYSYGANSSDGTIIGQFDYATNQSSVTINIQCATGGTNGCNFGNGSGAEVGFRVLRVTTESDQAISVDKMGWRIDASLGGDSSIALNTGTNATPAEITSSNLSLVAGDGSAPVEIACASGTASSGTTCTSANESVGIAFTPPTAGEYEACVGLQEYGSINAATMNTYLSMWETPNNSITQIQQGGASSTSNLSSSASVQVGRRHYFCGTYIFSDTSKRTLRVFQQTSGSAAGHNIDAERVAGKGNLDIKFTVRRKTEYQDAVKFTNLVTTNKKTGLTVNAARISNNGTCAIESQSGSWIDSVSHIPTGRCTITFAAGIFASAPACIVAAGNGDALTAFTNTLPTTSSVTVETRNSSINQVDDDFQIVCFGF